MCHASSINTVAILTRQLILWQVSIAAIVIIAIILTLTGPTEHIILGAGSVLVPTKEPFLLVFLTGLDSFNVLPLLFNDVAASGLGTDEVIALATVINLW